MIQLHSPARCFALGIFCFIPRANSFLFRLLIYEKRYLSLFYAGWSTAKAYMRPCSSLCFYSLYPQILSTDKAVSTLSHGFSLRKILTLPLFHKSETWKDITSIYLMRCPGLGAFTPSGSANHLSLQMSDEAFLIQQSFINPDFWVHYCCL